MHSIIFWIGAVVGGLVAAYVGYLVLLIIWHALRALVTVTFRTSQAAVAGFRGDDEKVREIRARYDDPPPQ